MLIIMFNIHPYSSMCQYIVSFHYSVLFHHMCILQVIYSFRITTSMAFTRSPPSVQTQRETLSVQLLSLLVLVLL